MQGTITKYFTDRAFGFIQPDGGTDSVFFHKTSLPRDSEEPTVNAIVEFVVETDPRSGRLRASSVRLI